MKKIRVNLTGEAEILYIELKNLGMSESSIIGKALKCLQMVQNGELIDLNEKFTSSSDDNLTGPVSSMGSEDLGEKIELKNNPEL